MASLELRIPPVLVVLAAALLMWAVAAAWPGARLDIPAERIVALAVALPGIVICAAGLLHFRRVRTTVNPMAPSTASALVTGGVYRFSRNPMYLGFALMLVAWGIFLENPPALAIVAAFVAYMTRFQIVPEERALADRFGAGFAAYAREVRRWI